MDVNEMEFDYYLCLARLFDEGFPSLSHDHEEVSSIPPSPTYGISEKRDPTPEECATDDAPSWE